MPVSSKTGEGLPALLAALDELADATPSRQAKLPLRLPVDRVFTIAGAGTVVTGTMWSGTAERDARVELHPSGQQGRVRGVQVHGEAVQRAQAGQRVALNVAGLEKADVSRGDIVAEPGTLTVTDRFDARVTFVGVPGDEKPFASGSRVHVHHGTREVLGRVLLMEGESLQVGQSMLAQVRLEDPLAPRYGDRFIIRSYSPVYTVGGGLVLDVLPPRRTSLRTHERELLEALLAEDLSAASVGLLASRAMPMTSAEVAAALGVPRAAVADELNAASLERVKAGGETYFVTTETVDSLTAAIERELLAFHDANPKATGMATAALRDRVDRRLPGRVFDAVLDVAATGGAASVARGEVHHPAAATAALAEEQAARDALLPALESAGLTPPSTAALAAAAGVDAGVARKVLGTLASEGVVVRLGPDMHFSAQAIEGARAAIEGELEERTGGATAAELREALGVSRKYAIPLLEYFDAQGVTRREGDLRVLKRG